MERPANAVSEAFRMNSLRVKRFSRIFLFHWMKRGWFGFYGFKFRVMGVMATGTEIVRSFAAPKISGPFPVNPCLPGSVDVPMTFAAETVAFRKIDELSIEKPEFIPVFWVVAVETPSDVFTMVKDDIRMLVFEFPSFSVGLHRSMTVTAGKHPLRQGRRRNRKLLLSPHHAGGKVDSK
jgi:hypothetical protein